MILLLPFDIIERQAKLDFLYHDINFFISLFFIWSYFVQLALLLILCTFILKAYFKI